ncbi:MAG TPA: amylo-alpha-1,6-glucosidase [Bacteroidales bacterium]|nr:amylo-alpha-1,6-glucosidase [Bacteroidales bacterium]
MAYLQFDKTKLINLEYSLNREVLRSNRAGSYSSTTIIGCNTRKYHGLLVCPVDKFGGDNFVFLSNLDESIIQHDNQFNLGIHKYPGDNYDPKGHKYVHDFQADVASVTDYHVGGVVLRKELLLVDLEEQILIRYTLVDSHSPTKIRFKPFLAFRNHHHLSKANMYADKKVDKVLNGIKSKMYAGFPSLYMQFSKEVDFVQVPDWYYNIEYTEEQERGYDFQEDLYVPGYFETSIKKGESIIFSGALKEQSPANLKRKFTTSLTKRIARNSFKDCLVNAAQQFVVRRNGKTEIIAGFPWFGAWGRDTFISLPGLTLTIDDAATFEEVVDTMVGRMKGGLFPNMGDEKNPAFNSVDAPLWFFWSLQQYAQYTQLPEKVWTKYEKPIKSILKGYKEGQLFNIQMHSNGLIYAGAEGKALTWMDAVCNSVPVTQRKGYPVEINALWYNAVCFSLELAEKVNDKKFISAWKDLPELIKSSFVETFWDAEKNYLADYVDGKVKNLAVRPNMVIAAALDYSPITVEMKKAVVDVVTSELLTPRGLRTLSPKNVDYKGTYEGNQECRDNVYHQGTVWPWLLEPYSRAYLKLHKNSGIAHIKEILYGFEEEMMNHGIGSVSEIYNGDPPHQAKGAISQAWSVAALLQMFKMTESQ